MAQVWNMSICSPQLFHFSLEKLLFLLNLHSQLKAARWVCQHICSLWFEKFRGRAQCQKAWPSSGQLLPVLNYMQITPGCCTITTLMHIRWAGYNPHSIVCMGDVRYQLVITNCHTIQLFSPSKNREIGDYYYYYFYFFLSLPYKLS